MTHFWGLAIQQYSTGPRTRTGEFLGNKTADAVTKSNCDNIKKQEPAEKLIIPQKKRWNIKQIKKSITKNGTLWNI